MKTCIISMLLLIASNGLLGQNISFDYDADGNMTSRYVVALRAAVVEDEDTATDIVTVEITGNPGIYLLNIHLGEDVSKWKIIKQ